jgi:uncharacterized membrane protein
MILKLLTSEENPIEITRLLFKKLGVKITDGTLKRELYHHPDYPSLLSISDITSNYGIENLAAITTLDRIREIEKLCIVPLKAEEKNEESYAIMSHITHESVTYYDPAIHRWKSLPRDEFENRWPSRIALFVNNEKKQDENDYGKKRSKEVRGKLLTKIGYWSLPLFVLFTSGYVLFNEQSISLALYLVSTLVGALLTGFIIRHELGQHIPLIDEICKGGRDINCNAVINSKASHIMGVSWGTIGAVYFLGTLLDILMLGVSNPIAKWQVAWINTFALPYILFSIYYQWRVVKQWCILCLAVLAIMIVQAIISYTDGWHGLKSFSALNEYHTLSLSFLSFLIPIIFLVFFIPISKTAEESKENYAKMQRFKHNPKVMASLLAAQQPLFSNTDGLGIFLGNINATHKIVKICNPYCGPCGKAHAIIDSLLNNNPNIQIQIIFTASMDENDIRKKPVKHLLAIAAKGDEQLTKQALDDWYLMEIKNYDAFARKYPMEEELKEVEENIREMSNWCSSNEIKATPTFFINGHRLPPSYTPLDLKYFLSI